MSTETMRPLEQGTRVRTTQPKDPVDDWSESALKSRKWNVQGVILRQHDADGLYYDVCHQDGTVGHYDPSELEVILELKRAYTAYVPDRIGNEPYLTVVAESEEEAKTKLEIYLKESSYPKISNIAGFSETAVLI